MSWSIEMLAVLDTVFGIFVLPFFCYSVAISVAISIATSKLYNKNYY